ncbi:cartilage intermediate layer protein 1 [Lates japonicus]|uniref:Cartilage intermediate layer protein 1 n=1 Tax=Lates japonicus TaxID=270547 RepID=A0AAD3NKB2_LATJO|nr:cartilage intermediate layer protein 1 [Lates japonicus]
MKDSRPNGWTYFFAETQDPISELHVIKGQVKVERWADRWSQVEVTTAAGLSYQISGELKVRGLGVEACDGIIPLHGRDIWSFRWGFAASHPGFEEISLDACVQKLLRPINIWGFVNTPLRSCLTSPCPHLASADLTPNTCSLWTPLQSLQHNPTLCCY